MKSVLPSFALRLMVVLLWVSLLLGGVGIRPAYAAAYTVNSLLDNTTDDSDCTLREAILAANNASGYNGDCGSPSTGDDTITFSVNGTITLISLLPPIVSGAGTLTINGGGNITISGNNDVAVIEVNLGAELRLQNLTITNGTKNGSGGGVFNNAGTLRITNSTFSNNTASVYGGGVYNFNGTLEITNSTFSGNVASGVSHSGGGGVYNFGGTVTIANSTFANNSATGSGGGGGVFNNGMLTVLNSTFSNNNVSAFGGGVHNSNGTLQIVGSTFSNNTASGFSYSTGGGMYNYDGTVTIANSTFANNSATGSSGGGGVFNEGTLTITNSTFSDNSATTGGGVRNQSGGALTLKNTILANSTGGDCVGTLSGSNINNLIESTGSNACGLTHNTNGNIIGFDPGLGALTGSPAYFPLNPGSPAINAGDNATCAAAPVNNQSKNGVTRPQGTSCDIGSYEAYFLFLPLVMRQ